MCEDARLGGMGAGRGRGEGLKWLWGEGMCVSDGVDGGRVCVGLWLCLWLFPA